jgi:hypothetical protein
LSYFLPEEGGARSQTLQTRSLVRVFAGRILDFDEGAARAAVDLTLQRRRLGRPIGLADAQIAGIVKSRSATLATRDVRDFDGIGIDLIDPWAAHSPNLL